MKKTAWGGYGIIRPAQDGYRIGPLFANTPEIAEIIFQGLCAKVTKEATIYIDIPETNPAAISLTNAFSMKAVFETARMYTKIAPDIAISKTFGITTFEIG